MDDLTGREYERLTVLSFVEYKNKHSYWRCECKCGNIIERVSGCDLKRKHTRSCGCLRKEVSSQRSFKHGDNTRGKRRHTLYSIWSNMLHRCNNKKYKNYGERGITYDLKWKSYEFFKKQVWYKFTCAKFKYGKNEKLSIERKNVNGNYCYDNCSFIPMREQSLNTRKVRWFRAIDPDGIIYVERNHTKFSRDNGLSQECVRQCLHNVYSQHKGWKFSWVNLKKKELKGK